jgi:hypothetical protein
MILVRSKYLLLLVTLLLVLLASLPSCTHDPANLDTLDSVFYDPQVMLILKESCARCHESNTEGFNMNDYQAVMQAVSTPGDPRACKLYQVITDVNGGNMMPPDVPLSQYNRTLIQVWIAQGAHEKKIN